MTTMDVRGRSLVLIDTRRVAIPATTEPFVVREKFGAAPFRIEGFSFDFYRWFFGKVEPPAPWTMLQFADLGAHAADGSVLEGLGDAAGITLTQVYALMVLQLRRGQGVLHQAGKANICYVPDASGVLRVVSFIQARSEDGWQMHARAPVTNPYRWYAGSRLFFKCP